MPYRCENLIPWEKGCFVAQQSTSIPRIAREVIKYALWETLQNSVMVNYMVHTVTTMNSRRCDVHVTVHRVKFLTIKPTRCTNFWNLFLEWNSTCFRQFLCLSSGVFHCTHSNGTCHTGLLTACQQDQDGTEFHPDPARKLSANLYDIYHCCVYSEKLLMIDRGIVRNM